MLTSPSIATLGMSVTVPLALLTDFVLHGDSPTAASGCGGVLVMIGFAMVNMPTEVNDRVGAYLFSWCSCITCLRPSSNDFDSDGRGASMHASLKSSNQ